MSRILFCHNHLQRIFLGMTRETLKVASNSISYLFTQFNHFLQGQAKFEPTKIKYQWKNKIVRDILLSNNSILNMFIFSKIEVVVFIHLTPEKTLAWVDISNGPPANGRWF